MNDKEIHKAIFGSPDKPLNIGGVEIQCYVLDNGERVISGRGLQEALNISRVSAGNYLSNLLHSKNLKEIAINKNIQSIMEEKIRFKIHNVPIVAYGYKSDTLMDLANFLIEADINGLLKTDFQKKIGLRARLITSSLSKTVLVELIDTVTGYRDVRRESIEKILDMYIKKEFALWAKRFPDEFYKLIFKLRKWPCDPESKKDQAS